MDDPIRMQLGCLSLAPSPLSWTRFRWEGLQCLIFAMTQDLGHRHFVSGQWGPLRRCTADLHAGMSWPLLFCPAAVRRERKTGMAPFKRRGSESHVSLCGEICHLPRAFSAEGLRPPGLGKGPSSFQSRLASHADFPPSFRVGELEGGLLYFFSSDLLEIAPVISTIGDEDIFAPAGGKVLFVQPLLYYPPPYLWSEHDLAALARPPALLAPLRARFAHSIQVSHF